ncbi:RDD family protein [Opitutus sp. ER46]|uniref:RDD family protein n=1 Tax=Opitutus sp. ER46 TaxID=2161864 RepID=UPI000D2F8F7C|nr:RDD family protein [Opitutus sp. ER46]PTX91500.1 hypothetical protein DB354_16565 [Opitutus sp. ER46]
MKTSLRLLLLSAFTCAGLVTFAAPAEPAVPPSPDQPAAAAPAPSATASTDSAAVVPDASAPPAAPVAPAAAAAPAAPVETEAKPDSGQSAGGELRRLDTAATEATDAAATPASSAKSQEKVTVRSSRPPRTGSSRVMIFENATLSKGENADAVVALMGNATADGDVADAVVAVMGNARATGTVGDSVVAVMGNVYVDGKVRDVVAVLGNVELGPNAEVRGDVVSVAGRVKRDPKAVVRGSVPAIGLPFGVGSAGGFGDYLNACLLKGRFLAFAPGLGWAWGVAAIFLAFYIVLALLFRGGMEKSVQTLETRPGGSILAALLTLLLTPVLILLLIITVVGIAVVPFVGIALLLATLFGKAVMIGWLGRRITRLFAQEGPMAHPAFAVLVGGVIVMLLYTVPVLAFITHKLLGVMGLGVVVYTLMLASKREKQSRPVTPAPAFAGGVTPPAAPASSAGLVGAAMATPADPADIGAQPAAAVAPELGATPFAESAVPPVMPVPTVAGVPPRVLLASLPRAGFWIRTGAMAIDAMLVWVILMLFLGIFPDRWDLHVFPLFLPALAAYGAALWKLRGTTIGGIICGLRVVRVDNRPIDWATAVVRALGCFVSLLIVGLGFIWVAIDDERQSWHDKIAGTTVVLSRENMALV